MIDGYANCWACGAPVAVVKGHRFVAINGRSAGLFCSVSCCPRCCA